MVSTQAKRMVKSIQESTNHNEGFRRARQIGLIEFSTIRSTKVIA
jgi:hypothetical protein